MKSFLSIALAILLHLNSNIEIHKSSFAAISRNSTDTFKF